MILLLARSHVNFVAERGAERDDGAAAFARQSGRVWVGWIRRYRPFRHPVNLRLTQAEIQNASTLLRG